MNLVEKINQVKIKADTRISGADRAFCERQQRAYDAAREALRELDFTWTDCISQQKMILDGECDSIPESCFLFAGTIDDVFEKAKNNQNQ